MKQAIVGIGIVGLAVLLWFIFQGSTIDYVATVDDEVSQLEMELSEIEKEVSAGTLTLSEASKSQEKIFSRLATVDSYLAASQKTDLTTAQKVMLLDGLDKLENILEKYQETLRAVDRNAMDLSEAERLNGLQDGETEKALLEAIANTILNIEGEVGEYIIKKDEGVADDSASSSDKTVDDVEGDENAILEGDVEVGSEGTTTNTTRN